MHPFVTNQSTQHKNYEKIIKVKMSTAGSPTIYITTGESSNQELQKLKINKNRHPFSTCKTVGHQNTHRHIQPYPISLEKSYNDSLKPNKPPNSPITYRSISLLWTKPKILERLVLKYIIPHIPLSISQYGFCPLHFTTTHFSILIQLILDNFNKKNSTCSNRYTGK